MDIPLYGVKETTTTDIKVGEKGIPIKVYLQFMKFGAFRNLGS